MEWKKGSIVKKTKLHKWALKKGKVLHSFSLDTYEHHHADEYSRKKTFLCQDREDLITWVDALWNATKPHYSLTRTKWWFPEGSQYHPDYKEPTLPETSAVPESSHGMQNQMTMHMNSPVTGQVSNNLVFCSSCGQTLEPHFRFCPLCGIPNALYNE